MRMVRTGPSSGEEAAGGVRRPGVPEQHGTGGQRLTSYCRGRGLRPHGGYLSPACPKGCVNNTKQTTEFEVHDTTFFRCNPVTQQLLVLPAGTASDEALLEAHEVSLRFRYQTNGWKNVCIFQESNGETYNCGTRAIARRVIHIRHHSASWQAARLLPLSTYFVNGTRCHVTQEDMSKHLRMAATMLNYPTVKNIPVDRVDTHPLRGGGANALSLSGYSDREIMKMGRWRSATFMEYIREDLSRFSEGMSKNMKRRFNFMHIAGGAGHDVTTTTVAMDYNVFSDDEADVRGSA